MVALSKLCVAGFAAGGLLAGTVSAETRIQGSGATFPAPLYAKWVQAYNAGHPEVKIDYQAVGSGAGIKGITDRTVMFAGSDAPMTADQEKSAGASGAHVLHLPTVAGPVVLTYNVPGVNELKIDGPTLADIFLGKVEKWNDGKLNALNAGANLPDMPITVVHRSDGSGTTFIFTNYLSKVSPDWSSKAGNATAVEWPTGSAGKGNDGVAAAVKKTEGAIGYVEWAYATKQKLPYALQVNKSGKAMQASIEGVQAAAAAEAASFPADMKVSITDAAAADAYPIAGFTYLLVYDDLSYLKDKAAAQQLLNFILWCETDGQGMAKDQGYAALPKDAQEKVIAKLKTITFDGEALLK